MLRGLVMSALARFEAATEDEKLESLEFQNALNLLKVNASELALATVMSCFQVCGLAGYPMRASSVCRATCAMSYLRQL
jgi:acyl-CoA dehydrogenase